jgi:hypothetical protein
MKPDERTEDVRRESSRDFFTERPARVRERTISKARKPTISTVSSLAFRSRCGGRLRNSRNRLATGVSIMGTRKGTNRMQTFSIGEGGLPTIRVALVFLPGHLPRCIICFLKGVFFKLGAVLLWLRTTYLETLYRGLVSFNIILIFFFIRLMPALS